MNDSESMTKLSIPKNILVLSVLFSSTFSLAKDVKNSCIQIYQTNSASHGDVKYALWLENQKLPESIKWVKAASKETKDLLHDSENFETISNAVLITNSAPKTISTDRTAKFIYELKFKGIGEDQSVRRINQKNGEAEDLLKTSDLVKDASFSLIKMWASPNDRYLILIASDNGNIDTFDLLLYDTLTKKVAQRLKTSNDQKITWKNNKEFYFTEVSSNDSKILKLFNLQSLKSEPVKQSLISIIDAQFYVETDKSHSVLKTSQGLNLHLPKIVKDPTYSILGVFTSKSTNSLYTDVYLHSKDYQNHKIELLHARINNLTQKVRWNRIYQTPNQRVADEVIYQEKYIISSSYWGSDIQHDILNYQGQSLATIKTPSCCKIQRIEINHDQTQAKVWLQSYFKTQIPYNYDLKKKEFLNPEFAKEMLTYNNIHFQSYVHLARSKDGTLIPTRITHKENLPLNNKNGALIYGYGGFGLEGYLRSFNQGMDSFFMQNGGIIVAPALRGGNEFGEPWHQSATFKNKNKTFEDFTAAADLLNELRLSSPSYTAIEGWSNGGMVVAATGLLYPDKIGHVISGNGVDDLLRKEFLDTKFGQGWSYEYGNSQSKPVLDYLIGWSPVYQAQVKNTTPHFLILNGKVDSRVNPSHSWKLAYALKEHSSTPENIHLLSIANSGHWMTSPVYQNVIAWRALTYKWTYLFNAFGIKAKIF